MTQKLWKSKKLMYRLWVVKKMTEQEIAEKLQTDQSTVSRWLKKHELKK